MNDPGTGGPQEPFNQKWDLASDHESTTTINSLQASQVILETLKTKRRTETAEWLNGLEKEISASNNSTIGAGSNPLLSANPMNANSAQSLETTMIGQAIQWLDKMFVQFELFAAQFNMDVRGTDLVVSCTRPIKRTNDTGGLYAEATDDCLSYAGHIATQHWALVVRGCATKVEVFIIPAQLLIAFSVNSSDESGYEPLLVIESAWRGKEIIWHMQDNIITADQIPALAKELFGDLIKVASGQMTEAEIIANPIQTISSNENPTIPPTTSPPSPAAKVGPPPLIEQLVNQHAPTTAQAPPPNSTAAQTAILSNTPSKASIPSIDSLKAADQLLILVDKDITHLLESGKKALEIDDTATFEQVKELTGKLEALKKTISVALSNLRQPN